MLAMLTSAALFAYLVVVGSAVITIFRPVRRLLQAWLIAPAIGLAVLILLASLASRIGLPARSFGWPLAIALAAVALVVIILRRPLFPARRLAPFSLLCIAAMLLSAWPMFLYGFDWLSFTNDDMANYSLAAERFLNQGFFTPPDIDAINAGTDYSQVYWFMHVAAGVRAGSDILLAMVWSVTGLNPHEAFMPVVVALHLCLILAAASIPVGAGAPKWVPLTAMMLMVISPLSTLGLLYQLIAQVAGLALLCGLVSLSCSTTKAPLSLRGLLPAIPAGALLAASLLTYPETVPFFGLAWLLLLAVLVFRSRQDALNLARRALPIGIVAVVLLGPSSIDIVRFLLEQATHGLTTTAYSLSIFPYFLIPSGWGVFLGVLPLSGATDEPFLSLAILCAMAVGVFLTVWEMPRQLTRPGSRAAAAMLGAMLIVAFALFTRQSGFGLFKLAMYAQPFLAIVLAIAAAHYLRNIVLRTAVAGLLVPIVLVQFSYAQKSTGAVQGGPNDIPRASALSVMRQFDQTLRTIPPDVKVFSTAASGLLAKYQALYGQDRPLFFLARDTFGLFAGGGRTREDVVALIGNAAVQFSERIYLYDSASMPDGNVFRPVAAPTDATARLIATQSKFELFNRLQPSTEDTAPYFVDITNIPNQLIFIDSSKGSHYYVPYTPHIAYYQLEADPLFGGRVMAGVGRNLLFQVHNPEQPRLELEITSTLARQFDSVLPNATVQGQQLAIVGRGTARVYSEPLNPTLIDGRSYISVDMGRNPRPFQTRRTGLMLLYGTTLSNDPRQITCFARDFSLVSEAEFRALGRPSSVSNFPADLADPALEYSGIYEDGWISERAFFALEPKPGEDQLELRGMVPEIGAPGYKAELIVSLDGVVVTEQTLTTGNFHIALPIDDTVGLRRIDLSFSSYQQLPGADGRQVAAKIEFIGFKESARE